MRAAFDAAYEFCRKESRAGDRPILEWQSVYNLLQSVKMRADACRMLTWKACSDLDEGKGAEMAIEAKVFCSEAAVQSIHDAMGAVGM
jgi:nitroalkane oxidase